VGLGRMLWLQIWDLEKTWAHCGASQNLKIICISLFIFCYLCWKKKKEHSSDSGKQSSFCLSQRLLVRLDLSSLHAGQERGGFPLWWALSCGKGPPCFLDRSYLLLPRQSSKFWVCRSTVRWF
jgi:hypothetical protein